jgi:hypothetical protein
MYKTGCRHPVLPVRNTEEEEEEVKRAETGDNKTRRLIEVAGKGGV